MRVQIERLQPGEGERWRAIRLRALRDAAHAFGTTHGQAAQWPPEHWEAQVLQFATFVAVVDGRDVGVARGGGHRSREARELISMWVTPTSRRKGIGTRLIDSVGAWAMADGASALVLDVVADNALAIAVYERTGFLRLDGDARGECAPGELRLFRSLRTPSG